MANKRVYIRPAYYLNVKNVKDRVRSQGKQVSRSFLRELDGVVERLIDGSCRQWNGRHKRLTAELIPTKLRGGK